MSSEWPSVRLGDVVTLTSGGTPSKANPAYWGGDIPWVSAKDMKTLRLFAAQDTLTPTGAQCGTRVARAGSILILVRGMTLHNDVPICRAQVDMAFNQDVKAIIPGESVDGDFLLYALLASKPRLLQGVDSSSHGTGRINADVLTGLRIALPDLRTQRAIASVLGALDDKIELNRKMSRTLDEAAKTSFALACVEPAGEGWLSGEGVLPAGWSRIRIGEHLKIDRGLSYSGTGLTQQGDGLPLHNLNSVLEGGGYKWDGVKWYSGEYKERHVCRPGDLLVTNTEQGFEFLLIGFPCIVPRMFGQVGIFSHHTYKVEPNIGSPLTREYLYWLLRDARFHRVVAGFSNGTTVNMLPVDALQMPVVAVPPKATIAGLSALSDAVNAKLEANQAESVTLRTLRDALLPRLLSGELRVADAEKVVEEVV